MNPSTHSLEVGVEFVFQYDNAQSHTSRRTKKWFEENTVMVME